MKPSARLWGSLSNHHRGPNRMREHQPQRYLPCERVRRGRVKVSERHHVHAQGARHIKGEADPKRHDMPRLEIARNALCPHSKRVEREGKRDKDARCDQQRGHAHIVPRATPL